MLVKIYGAAVQGIDAIKVTIEVDASTGIAFHLVGLPDTAVKESYQRVVAALRQSGIGFPKRHFVINLAPADVKKEGAAYDLPIAIGILAAAGKIPADTLGRFMIMGELSLDGSLMPIRGALPMSILARSLGFKGMIVPKANATEAAVVNRLAVYGADNITQVIDFLSGKGTIEQTIVDTRAEFAAEAGRFDFDFKIGRAHV